MKKPSSFLSNKFILFFTPLIFIIFISITLTIYNLSYIENKYKSNIKIMTEEYLLTQKKHLKFQVDFIVNNIIRKSKMPNFKESRNSEQFKQHIINRLSKIEFIDDIYLFVFKHNKVNNKIKKIVNKNSPELLGKSLPLKFFTSTQ